MTAFSCNCTGTGFDGEKCQNNIDDCKIDSCLNGGTCIDGINCIFFFYEVKLQPHKTM